MLKHTFYKYQGTGNDFVIIDHRKEKWIEHKNTELINKICDRRFGIGADGLILLEEDEKLDFRMVYFNADGKESSMCGNGGRCILAFAKKLGIINEKSHFNAIDGIHEGNILGEEIQLKMGDVSNVRNIQEAYVLNTGSPHYVKFVPDLDSLNIIEEGRKIRYSDTYKDDGINVNLVEVVSNGIGVRTYERGVEWETLSCGTGVTACALAFHLFDNNESPSDEIKIQTKGGNLRVKFEYDPHSKIFTNIWLIGPAEFVFQGEW